MIPSATGSLTRIRARPEVAVLDTEGTCVAVARTGEVALASGEVLRWARTSFPTRYRLGTDLWVAKGSWRSRRRFSAELSEAMLARDDRALLVAIASVLTRKAVENRARAVGAAAAAGG